MSQIEKIKSTPITSILDKLWYEYKKTWTHEYRLYDWWELSDGRTATDNEWKNFVHDHSWKWRCSWDPFWFVKCALNLTDSEVFKWFAESFWYEQEKNIADVWRSLNQLNNNQRDYLKSRWIDYEKVRDFTKDFQWWIWCLVYEWEIPRWLTARTLNSDHSKRFIAASWFSTKWLYKHRQDNKKNYIIAVEWLIDFLTLRQFDTNVVWLKSAWDWFEQLHELAKSYTVIYVPDNDSAWKETLKKMSGIEYKLFDLSEFEEDWITIKDINDLYALASSWVEFPAIIDMILEKAQYVAPISWVMKALFSRQKIIRERWKLWEDWPFPMLDELTQWIVKWATYTIAAYSNVWKSKWSYAHIAHFLKKWKKVLIINLEVDDITCLANVIAATEWVTLFEAQSSHKPNEKLYKKLIIKDSIIKLDDISACVTSYMPDIVFIDYVQNIQCQWSSYEKHATIAAAVQRLWIDTWATIFALSQLSNDSLAKIKEHRYDEITPKNAWEYFACSDVIYLLYMLVDDANEKEFNVRIIKNKYWPKPSQSVSFNVDWNKNQYMFKQINKDD